MTNNAAAIMAGALLVLAGYGVANAQSFPMKPIRFVVPFSPGSGKLK